MRTEIIDVTPIMALEWLDTNENNRRVSLGAVKKYALDMASGSWHLHHQGLAFYQNGKLADGQHRLLAIVRSDCTVRMMVTFGVDNNSSMGIDTLRVRSDIDQLKIAGEGWVKKDYISTIRVIIDLSGGHKSASPHELLRIASQLRGSLDFVAAALPRKKHISSAPVLAAVMLAHWNRESEIRLLEFCVVLASGIVESKYDTGAIRLRDFVTDNPGFNRGAVARRIACLKAQRAVKAFCENEQITRLTCPKTTVYAIPGFI